MAAHGSTLGKMALQTSKTSGEKNGIGGMAHTVAKLRLACHVAKTEVGARNDG
jgi:hypothetical protein